MQYNYERPNTLDEALSLLKNSPRKILAGGTDVYAALGDHNNLQNVLDITAISGLSGIEDKGDHWRIGASSTWSDLIDADLPRSFDCLKLAAREVGGIQIQNAGTIAGNLCNASPAADGVPPLMATNASVELSSVHGQRIMKLKDFIIGPRQTELAQNELMSAILLPKYNENSVSSFLKLGSRKYLVISISMVAVLIEPEKNNTINDIGISVGSCSAVACRLSKLEDKLRGCNLDQISSIKFEEEFFSPLTPIDDIRSTGKYRFEASMELVNRAIFKCVDNLK
ncbi:MAG: xanthine dehydrogenase [Gammaproteobacteria bacterium]|nr:xanthine dehydrogenase [Gammaproteobacteria bacterium]